VPTVSDRFTASAVPFEPHCLMTWREQVAGMDDMAGLNRTPGAEMPHHASPGVGPMGAGQPADAGPVECGGVR
jgi:hypothetical protein